MFRKIRLGRTHARHVRQVGDVQTLLAKHFAEQTGVSGIVLDQENRFYRIHASLYSAGG
jgi:hypothetical protein